MGNGILIRLISYCRKEYIKEHYHEPNLILLPDVWKEILKLDEIFGMEVIFIKGSKTPICLERITEENE